MSDLRLELIKMLKSAQVITKEPVRLASGLQSDFYLDIRKAYGNPETIKLIAQMMTSSMSSEITCVASEGYGGIPLATMVASLSGKKLTLLRKTEKNHGLGGKIVGYVPGAQDVVLLVDDVFTTGSSLKNMVSILLGTGANILGCSVVVARSNTTDFSLPVSYILKAKDIM